MAEQYRQDTGDNSPMLIASTASPYKFAKSVLGAVSDKGADSEFEYVRLLNSETDTDIPSPIAALENAQVRFKNVCDKDKMLEQVYAALGIKM